MAKRVKTNYDRGYVNAMDKIRVFIESSSKVMYVDADLIMHINSVLMILRQMGVGPQEGFGISDATATWSEFCQNRADIEAVKSYTALKVKMLFDPPQSSSTMEATKNLISELEWRLYAECDREEKQCGC